RQHPERSRAQLAPAAGDRTGRPGPARPPAQVTRRPSHAARRGSQPRSRRAVRFCRDPRPAASCCRMRVLRGADHPMSTHAVTRRGFLQGLGGAAALLTATSFANAAVTPFKLEINKIDVYGTRDPQLMAMPSLAEVSGYFKDEGLTVERHFVASAGELPNMLASGNISIGCGGVTTLLILGGQGVPVYGVLQQADISGTQALVLGRKLANITDTKALNGIKVGQTQGNSPIEVWTGLATELGVDRSSVKIFNLKPPELVVALDKGDIDAMASFQPYIYQATQAGAKLIATGNRSYWPGKDGPRNWVRSNSM